MKGQGNRKGTSNLHGDAGEVRCIVSCLRQIMLEEGYSNLVVNEQIRSYSLEGVSANRVRKVVYGTVERWLYLEAWLDALCHKRVKPDVRMLLMAGLYELQFLSGTYDHVIVNRYVAGAKQMAPHAKDFVHAVLRTAQREPLSLTAMAPLDRLSLTYSHPKWLVGKWLKRFGEEETQGLLAAGLRQRPLYLRVNTLKATRDQVLKALADAGAEAQPDQWLDNAVVVSRLGPNSLETLPIFAEGWVTVQDVSSMLVGHVAAPASGERWLDLCAAPGGKATDLATRVSGPKGCDAGPDCELGTVVACDLHPHKLPLIQENAERLGLSNIELRQQDAGVQVLDFEGAFDGVLLDAPCSGFGIIGRKPEIKYRKRPEDVGALAGLQKQLLELAGDYVKPGGYLIYSTCTIFKEENEQQIEAFLSAHPDFQRVSLEGLVPVGIPAVEGTDLSSGMVSLRQSNGWSDGFFIARLQKCPS